ncbi:LemA family protein [bacterium]|nr:LemA family protein [bacterium]
MKTRKGNALWVIIVLIVIVLLGVLWVAGIYNKIVSLDESVNKTVSEIDNQLQRRADLIPNLISTVKGYMEHEKEIFISIADARQMMITAKSMGEKIQANGQLQSALGRLFAIAENYPDLKANETFLNLMDELSGTENRIAVARKRYNGSLEKYNISVRTFPGVMIARFFNFQIKEDYFKAPKAAKEVPKVLFDK